MGMETILSSCPSPPSRNFILFAAVYNSFSLTLMPPTRTRLAFYRRSVRPLLQTLAGWFYHWSWLIVISCFVALKTAY